MEYVPHLPIKVFRGLFLLFCLQVATASLFIIFFLDIHFMVIEPYLGLRGILMINILSISVQMLH